MLLQERYHVTRLLGDGTFGRVLLAEDQRDGGRQVAVKVIRGVRRHVRSAKTEAEILRDIRKKDPMGEFSRSVIMSAAFSLGQHFCLVLEPCGSSLYEFLKKNSFRGFWLQDVQSIARQSLEGLSFLHGAMRLTHTDLKPENILLESTAPALPCDFPRVATWRPSKKTKASAAQYMRPASPSVKLIDFGNATYADAHHSRVINTRQYRSPEVILDLGWDEKSDIWSMGCILMELYTGELLFGAKGDLEHLALMERSLGPMPKSMLGKAPQAVKKKYLAAASGGGRQLRWPDRSTPEESRHHVNKQRPLPELTAQSEHRPLADVVARLLTLEKAKRPSAEEGLRHKFFEEEFAG